MKVREIRLTVLVHVEIHVIEIVVRRVKEILRIQLQARQLHLALVEIPAVASVLRGQGKVVAIDRRPVLRIVKEALVVNYMSVALGEETRVYDRRKILPSYFCYHLLSEKNMLSIEPVNFSM